MRREYVLNDGIGYIELVDSMPQYPMDFDWYDEDSWGPMVSSEDGFDRSGSSLTNAEVAIVEAARVSTGNGLKGFEKDKKLLNYLYDHGHTSPFEQVVFKFRVKAPLFVVRQWFRHRTASYNEISARYSVIKDEFYTPYNWRVQDHVNKQGSIPELGRDGDYYHQPFTQAVIDNNNEAYARYEQLIEEGVAREMARLVLPVNIYTEFVYTVNLHNLMHFIKLRNKPDAQYEIRVYAEWLVNFVKECLPNVESVK